jgi:hypothetical protein
MCCVLYPFVSYLLTLLHTTCILKLLIFEIHVTVEWGNIFLGSVICYGAVRRTEDTHCKARASCERIVMEHTLDEYCDMLLTLGTCNSLHGETR